jgi:hypothetical protein
MELVDYAIALVMIGVGIVGSYLFIWFSRFSENMRKLRKELKESMIAKATLIQELDDSKKREQALIIALNECSDSNKKKESGK